MTSDFSSNKEIIKFPCLIDSEVSSSVITLNNEFVNEKEKITQISLTLLDDTNNLQNIKYFCDFSNMVNLNYKFKSACSQIEECVKTLANK